MNLNRIIEESERVLLQEFKVIPERSTYVLHQDWDTFLAKTGTTVRPHGIYLPRMFSANLNVNSPYLLVNLLHEYFGHGLFCEYSFIGQRIVSNEERLMEIEKEILSLDKFPIDEILQIPLDHPLIPKYRGIQSEAINFLQQSWSQYEGFAIWMEHHLAQITGNQDLFMKKLEDHSVISDSERQLFEWFTEFENKAGKYAVFWSTNMPKYYEPESLVEMLQTMYHGQLGEKDIIILYGSQKPYSDIDLFIVSDTITSYYNDWIDIYAVTHDDFERHISLFDISLTDPIFSGTVIYDLSKRVPYYRKLINGQPITQEAIQFNLSMSEQQARLAEKAESQSRERKVCLSYANTYSLNAQELDNGNKILVVNKK